MSKCVYELIIGNESYVANSQKELEDYLLLNYDRLVAKLDGVDTPMQAAKNIPHNLSRIAFNMTKIQHEVKKGGGVVNDYSTALDAKIERPLQELKRRGFTAITSWLDTKTASDAEGNVKKIILTYDKQKHREALIWMNAAAKLQIDYKTRDEELKERIRVERARIFNDVIENQQLEKQIDDTFEAFEFSNLIGRAIHDGLSLGFKRMNDNKELSVDSFYNLNEANITNLDLSDLEKVRFQTSLYNMLMHKSDGLYKKLNLDNQQYIYSEMPIMYENEKGTKLVGIIDLVVVDKQGNVRIYDFKTSLKNDAFWSPSKAFRMTQQLGYYKAMLEAKGLNVLDAEIIPIEISIDKEKKDPIDFKIGQFLSVQGSLLGQDKKFQRIVAQILEDIPEEKVAKQLNDTDSLKDIDDFLTKTLGISYKDKKSKTDLNKQFEKAWKSSERKDTLGNTVRSFLNPNTGVEEHFLKDKTKQKQRFISEKESYLERTASKSVLDFVANTFDRYKAARAQEEDLNKRDLIPFSFGRENDRLNVNFNRLFGKYKSDEWMTIPNQTANMLGFMIFSNKITKTIDIVSVSNEILTTPHKLPFGKTILGNKFSDFSPTVLNEKDLLEQNVGNIELLKMMTFINFNTEFFLSQGYKIGDIKVVNQFNEGTFLNFELLRKNFVELIKAYDLKDKYYINEKIQMANPVENLMLTIAALSGPQYAKILGFDSRMSDFSAKLNKAKEQDERTHEQIKNDILIVLNEELTKRRSNKEMSAFKNPEQADWFTKMIADQILYYTDSYKPAFERDIHKFALWTNSIKNVSSPSVGAVQRTLTVAIENIKSNFLKTKQKSNKVTYALFEDKGYGKFRRYTLGDHPMVYQNLFVKTDGAVDVNLMLKDVNDPTLSNAERAYLRTFFTIINEGRGVTESLDELSQKGDLNYRKIPLVKLQSLILFKEGDWNTKFQQWLNKIYNPAKSMFEGEGDQESLKTDQFLEMWNSTVMLPGGSEQRTKILSEHNPSEFETDLEAVLDIFVLTQHRQKAFNDVLPIISSIKIAAVMNNIGVLKEIDPILDFIDNHLKINVRGERLTQGATEKQFDKKFALMRQFTAMANLILNPISITREFTQSLYGSTSRAAIQMYGKNRYNFNDFAKQFAVVSGKSLQDTYQDTNLVECLNVINGMSNMSLNSMIDRSSTTKTGLPHLYSNYMQGFNRAPEYMVRMTILIAELIHDDAWKAYSFVDGEMKYDWKKDGRFEIYTKGLKSDPQYSKQAGLYRTLLAEFNSMSTDVVYTDLPAPYTNRQIESIKLFADSILGYYDPESRIQQQSTLFGAMFLQFSAWKVAIKDKYYMPGHKSQISGEYILMKDDFGNQIYVAPDGTLTREKGINNVEAYLWNYKWNEGILQSLVKMYEAGKTGKFENMKNLWEADERLRSNIKLMLNDLLFTQFMQLFAGLLQDLVFGDDIQKLQKEDGSGTLAMVNAVLSSPQDLNPFNTLGSFANPAGGWLFPSFSYFSNVGLGAGRVMFGDKKFESFVFDSFGVLRPFRPLVASDE